MSSPEQPDTARLWDVLVVGAGPAGSTAARVARQHGADVLIVDRAHFPRYKTCGGGLLGVSLAHIPPEVAETIECEVRRVVFTHRGGDPVVVSRDRPFVAMTRRERFDDALLESARDSGAVFSGGITVTHLDDDGEQVTVRTASGEQLRARIVVGADGTSGRTARFVGVVPARVDLGLEDEIERTEAVAEADAEEPTVRLDWGPGPGSYAWVFPKDRLDTVGVIEAKGSAPRTREYLAGWVAHTAGDEPRVRHSSGHLTQCRRPDSPVGRGRVIVAGDAAGLLDPWTREGISFALRSGRLAGIAAAEGARGDSSSLVEAYTSAVEEAFGAEMRVGAILLRIFERHPRLVHRVLGRSRRAQRFFVEFCSGQTTLGRFERHRIVMRIAALLAGREGAGRPAGDGPSGTLP